MAGQPPGRQGQRRRLDFAAIRTIDLVGELAKAGLSATHGLPLVMEISAAEGGKFRLSSAISLTYSRAEHEADLKRRLADAAERMAPRRRGRPKGSGR